MPSQPQPSQPETAVNNTIEQEQLNNFLGPVNGALGGLPVAEKNQSYFVVFIGAGGTGPEIIDETAYFITYLVDENGNVSKPSEDYASLYNLNQNFEVGKNVIVRNDAASAVNGQLVGKQRISAVGKQEPILYSQTGSSEGANVSSLNFDSAINTNVVPRALFWLNKGPAAIGDGVNSFTAYNAPLQSPEAIVATVDEAAGTYTVTNLDVSPADQIQNVIFSINVQLESWNDEAIDGEIQLTKGGIVIGNTLPFDLQAAPSTGVPFVQEFTHLIQVQSADLVGGVFKAQITINLPSGATSQLQINYLNFKITNQNPETTVPATNLPFWNRSDTNTWVTASNEISLNYGNTQNSQNVLNEIEPGFNFSPITIPFIVTPGDRIRFGYNKENDYTIYEVIEPSQDVDGRLKLKLNSPPPPSSTLNSFVLHKVDTNNPVYIILDVKKVGGTQGFNGVILPEYPTKKLRDNLDNIIINLKERGIITDNET